MAVYSTMISNELILEKVRDFHATNILLIACGGCANESLAYAKKLPVFISKEGEPLEKSMLCGHSVPYAVQKTADQIVEMLCDKGYYARACIVPINRELLCIQSKDNSINFLNSMSNVDLILALCCPAGIMGIKKQIKDIPTISLMRPQGQLFYVYRDNMYSREIVYEESFVL